MSLPPQIASTGTVTLSHAGKGSKIRNRFSPGETLATTGASGGNEETGLYFELRYLGKAFDPLRWVKLK